MVDATDLKSVDPDSLFARARSGDDAAWEELFRKCYPKLIRAVRRKLEPQMRSVFDSTDFASDVMKSLAANAGRLDFPSFNSLLAFLETVAKQKVIDEYRKAHTLKRDISRQCALAVNNSDDAHPIGVASADPTASQVAQATEVHERLVSGQKEPEQRAAIELKEQGYTLPEIAKETGWHLRKVQRFFKDLEEQLYARLAAR
jgi:RNA polymerase sigma factor (sigma-70 family)